MGWPCTRKQLMLTLVDWNSVFEELWGKLSRETKRWSESSFATFGWWFFLHLIFFSFFSCGANVCIFVARLRALKRQTDSQAEAYLRLMEENNQLKVGCLVC